jgi:hypothetical protein
MLPRQRLTFKLNAIKIIQIWSVVKYDISFLVIFFSLFTMLSFNLATQHGVLCQGLVAPRNKRPRTRL